ncbi:hypothetical protein AAMO2058_000099000 [Amorphochlora amoebiformis]
MGLERSTAVGMRPRARRLNPRGMRAMLAMFVVLFAGYSAVSLGYHGEGRARVGKYNGRVGFGLGKNSLMVRPGMSRIRNNDELRRKFLNAKTPMDLQTCLEVRFNPLF